MLFLILLAHIASISPVALGQGADYFVSAKRVATLYQGYVVLNDTFTLQPIRGLPETFMVGIPKYFSTHVVRSIIYPYSVSSTGEILTVEWAAASDATFDWISIKLPMASGIFTFSVIQAYSDVLLTTQYGSAQELNLPAVPALGTEMNSCYTEVRLIRWWSIDNPPSDYTEGTSGNLTVLWKDYGRQPANTNLTVHFNLTPLTQEVYTITLASRVIQIDPFSGLTVTDRFRVMYLSYSMQGYINVFLLMKASSISAGDDIGAFQPSSESATQRSMFSIASPTNSSLTKVSIYPRYFLYPNQNLSFYLTYHLPLENVSGISSIGRAVSFVLPATTNFTSFADNFTLEVLLPVGARVSDVKLGEFDLKNEASSASSFSATIAGATKEIFDSPIALTYSFDTLWAGFAPSMAVALFFLVGFAYVFTRHEGISEARVPPVEMGAVAKFVERQREKIRLEGNLERLQEDLRNNRISRQEYKARNRSQAQRLEEVTRSIPALKVQATKASRAVADLISGIEVSEAEIMSMNSVIRDLNAQFSQKRISRAAYTKLQDDYAKRIQNEKRAIGAALNELESLSGV
jgi:hypothetical protein